MGETLFSFCSVYIKSVAFESSFSKVRTVGDYGLLSIFFSHRMSFKLKGRQGDTLVTVLVQSYWNSLHCGDGTRIKL